MDDNSMISTLRRRWVPADDFTPLDEHQEQTPNSFFDEKPVLHNEIANLDVLIPYDSLARWQELQQFYNNAISDQFQSASHNGPGSSAIVVLQSTAGWITSKNVVLSARSNATDTPSSTLIIPYPAISLHASQRLSCRRNSLAGSVRSYEYDPPRRNTEVSDETHTARLVHAIYFQLDGAFATSANTDQPASEVDDDASNPIDLYIVPNPEAENNAEDVGTAFEALSRCADLHPDPMDDDSDRPYETIGDGDGMLGDGGWITAENAHLFVDEDGNSNLAVEAPENANGLGLGAGSRRSRDAGSSEHEDDNKWQRTG